MGPQFSGDGGQRPAFLSQLVKELLHGIHVALIITPFVYVCIFIKSLANPIAKNRQAVYIISIVNPN
jgi:hypothetical protein